jgi:hypothetical protein
MLNGRRDSTQAKVHNNFARQASAFMATATEWEEYLVNSSHCKTTSLNVDGLRRRLEDPEGLYFSSDDDINVRITDIGNGERPLQHSSTSN